ADAVVDPAQPVAGGLVLGGARGQPRLEAHFQAADSDLEELVEVVAEDREELRALEHRQRLSVGERENSLVEIEPGGLSIEEAAARLLADDREFRRELAASGPADGGRLWL